MLQGMERIHGPMPPCHIRNGMQIPNGFPHLPNHANLPFSAIQMACAQVMERTRAGAPPVQPQPAGPIMLPNGRIQMPPLVSLPAHHPAGRKTPTRPVHHTSPVQQRQMQPPPPPPALPRPPSLPVQGPPSAHKQTPVGLLFSQEDLDMVLYGYARNKGGDQLPGHALSGLRLGDLSPGKTAPTSPYHRSMHAVPTEAMMGHCPAVSTNYGIDRILGGSPNSKLTLPAPRPIDTSLLDIPDGLGLYQTTFAGTIHCGIYCRKTVIPRGTKFGPFQGKQVNTSEIKTNDDNTFMWEVFQEGRLSHFVDGRGASGNWMSFVNCARYAQEQNLLAVQTEGAIFYEACKDIPQGTELLVWYGDCYLQFMGIPVALKEMADLASQEELENSEGFRCDRCGKVFAYKYYRDKHLKYTRCVDQGDRKFPCHLCTRSFEKRDRLRIHILHVHEKHRPHKCTVCGKSFSQSSSLNKHMRVHSGERPYKCVYCSKAFTASSILRTHIRQHSGEKPFKCKHCGKAFASHAAHDSHVRRTHTRDKPVACDVCGKLFQQVYELRFHMRTHEGTIINTRPNTVDMMTSFRQTGCDDAIDVVNLERTDGHVIPAL